ncbi:MAG: hypothetical protein P8144_06640, partial [Gammaproteobacteria bacterium]
QTFCQPHQRKRTQSHYPSTQSQDTGHVRSTAFRDQQRHLNAHAANGRERRFPESQLCPRVKILPRHHTGE